MAFENHNITYLQKMAVKGEVATILMHALTKADIDYCIYYILKESDEKYRDLFLEAIKESIDISEESLNKILFEVINKVVPVEIWINKILSDISLNLRTPETIPYIEALPFKRAQEKKNILISAFIMFIREVIMVCPPAAEKLISTILETQKFDFLHPACFYLIEGCREIQNFDCCSNEISEEIFKLKFDPRNIMSVAIETNSISLSNDKSFNDEAQLNEATENSSHNLITVQGSISSDQLSQVFGPKILELLGNISNEGTQTNYIVQKEFINTDIKTDIAEYETEEEALKFIEKMKRENPELQRTCSFKIRKKAIKN